MKKYQVLIIDETEKDILDIYSYVSRNDSAKAADNLITKLEQHCLSLEKMPERGHYPPELSRIAISTFREIHFKPYRIIYQMVQNKVFIHCVFDGRRDLDALLTRRLLLLK